MLLALHTDCTGLFDDDVFELFLIHLYNIVVSYYFILRGYNNMMLILKNKFGVQ